MSRPNYVSLYLYMAHKPCTQTPIGGRMPTCPAVITGCVDSRMNIPLREAVNTLGIIPDRADVLRVPGGAGKHPFQVAKQVIWLTEQHSPTTIVLTGHADCAAKGTIDALRLTGGLVSYHLWTFPHNWMQTPKVHVLWFIPAEGVKPPYQLGHWTPVDITAQCTDPHLKGLGALQLRWLLYMALQGRFPS